MDYIALKEEVAKAGLLDRRYGYYALKFFSALAMVAGFGFLILYFGSIWLQLPLILALTFAFLQFAFLGHDSGHMAVFRSRRANDMLGFFSLGLMCGVGYNYWFSRHNAHHTNPNHEEDDPDFDAFAQTKEELLKKRGFTRFIYERQHWMYLPITSLYVFLFHVKSAVHNCRIRSSPYKWTDISMMTFHMAIVWVLPFLFMAWWKAIIFIISLRLLMGVYFGSVSATNHKGMMVLKKGQKVGFAEKQILTTRNVKGNPVVDYVYGGLNYQMEHHLFPSMPRCNLKRCRPFVMKFCQVNSLPYEETGVVKSYRQIIGSLRAVAVEAKKARLASKGA